MARPRIRPIIGKEVLPRSGQTTREARAVLEKVIADGERFAADYPPAPPASTYVRTRTLGRSWTRLIRSGGNRLVGVVFSNRNIAPYNVWVQGPMQRDFHQRRGWRDIDAIADYMRDIMLRRMPGAIFRPFGR